MLDEKDRLLLKELIADSRQRIVELSRKCGITRQSVYNRIRKLRERGVEFTVNLNPRELGLELRAYILITADPNIRFRRETDRIIRQFEEVSQIHYILGRFDIIVEALVKNIDELRSLLRRIQELPAVKKTETLLVYETTKLNGKDPLLRVL